ncbi:MAG: ATP-dependent Clp protease ATP-binding subunit ClpA, partial [Clostridiaceae bacterium]|nr:ATP-dependent Clp protease ATP-binding subunit ClpA [Clostridiaceae bacterium]
MNITNAVNNLIIRAYEEAKLNKDEYITPEHLLYAAMFNREVINTVVKCGGKVEELKTLLKQYINENVNKVEDLEAQESYGFKQIIFMASIQAESSGRDTISVDHLISVIFELKDSYALFYLIGQGITKRDFLYNFCHEEQE